MKHVKKLLSFVLAVALLVTACFTDGFGVFAGLMDSTANTSVTKIDIANKALRFKLSTNDYGTTDPNNSTATSYTDYNYWENILIYTDAKTSKTLKEAYKNKADAGNTTFYNLWGDYGTYAVSLDQDSIDNAVKVVIPAGTQFPSYTYTNNPTTEKKAYVTTADITFVKKGDNWEEYIAPTPVDTRVTRIDIANKALRFKLSTNDYGTTDPNNPTATSHTDYNYWENILIYTDATTSKTLKEAYKNKADAGNTTFYNLWGDYGTYAVSIDTDSINNAVKVVIPAGTEFPSYTYTNNTTTEKKAYVTTADITFVKKGDNWEEYIAPTPVDTRVTRIDIANKALRFKLSTNDYGTTDPNNPTATSHTDYNYWENILIYTDATTSKTLKEAYKNKADAGNTTFYNLWGDYGTYAVSIDTDSINNAVKVVIPAGTEFPSYTYTNNTTTEKKAYVTTADITFVKNGDVWEEYVAPTTEDTSVTELAIANGAFRFRLSNNDYEDYGKTEESGSNTSADKYTAEYNYLDNVLVYTDSTTSYKLKDKHTTGTHHNFFNLWTDWGTFAVQIDTTVLNAATKVVIPAGTEFPSYGYTNGATKGKISYVTTDDITFVKKGDNWEEYIEHEDIATNIEKIHVRDGCVLLFLSNHDYAEVRNNTPIGDRLSAYNLTDSIAITTDSGTKKLSEILGTRALYNIWEESGCVAIEMQSGYDGTTIKKIAIKKGAEFPAYAYTSTSTKKVTSYVTDKDYVFNTSKTDAANNTEWTKTIPHSTETNVSGVTVSDSTLTFTLSENDYVAGKVGSNHTDFDYWNKVKVYTDDTTAVTLGEWADSASATYGSNTLSLTGNGDIVRVVIPAKTLFPSYKYTSGQIGECVGYYVPGEVVFEKQDDGTWKDISVGISNVSGDVNGDNVVDSKDLVAMAKYLEKGYCYNASSLTYDSTVDDATNRQNVRKVLLGESLHNYVKESDSLTYFSSSDVELDSFLNDFYKRQVGYNDYVEGDMTVTSYKPGTHSDGVFNMGWTTPALTWLDTANSLETDRLASQKKILENVIVDEYGYVWSGDDTVEDTSTNMLTNGAKRSMSWTFPNALHTNQAARFWEFHDATTNLDTSKSTWSSNIGATISNGVYSGTANNASSVTFEVVDKYVISSSQDPIIKTQYAPWLAIDLRMNTADYANIDDIYVSFTTSKNGSYIEVKASDIAALDYDFTEDYAHMLWLPMYQNENWIGANGTGASIYKLKIEIKAKTGTTLSGTFALNYVRPSFDTRDSNTNGIYISSLKQYFDYTGDMTFLNENIAKAEKAMNLYMEMYDSSRNLIKQSYFYGHNGDRNSIESGVGNGYWDTLYKPEYDFESNMYFYQALKDLAEMEAILGNDTSTLNSAAAAVLTAMQADVTAGGFYNSTTGRFAAGQDSSGNTVDYGYTTWNLQAIDLGIATDEQKQSIMSWIDGTRTVAGSSEQTDLYAYGFAPRTATVNDKNIYGYLTQTQLTDAYNLGYGKDVQFGGAVMYTSYYDLTSRISVLGADNALGRLQGIQSWYEEVSAAYKNSSETANNFYLPYFTGKGITMQNGLRGTGNGAVGIDGEFTESLLVAAAIPYGFFGMDSEGGNTLCVSPSLPSTMDRWKVENMQYNGVTYDLSIYKDAVRIDSVRGTTTGLKVKVTLDCPAGKDIYVNGVEQNVTAGGKATVTVDFADAIIEVR